MLSLNITLNRKGASYDAILTAEDGGQVLHTEDWQNIKTANKLSRRMKIVNLSGKSLAICLNVLNSGAKKKSSTKKPKKPAKKR